MTWHWECEVQPAGGSHWTRLPLGLSSSTLGKVEVGRAQSSSRPSTAAPKPWSHTVYLDWCGRFASRNTIICFIFNVSYFCLIWGMSNWVLLQISWRQRQTGYAWRYMTLKMLWPNSSEWYALGLLLILFQICTSAFPLPTHAQFFWNIFQVFVSESSTPKELKKSLNWKWL